jgi:hypothetical protein
MYTLSTIMIKEQKLLYTSSFWFLRDDESKYPLVTVNNSDTYHLMADLKINETNVNGWRSPVLNRRYSICVEDSRRCTYHIAGIQLAVAAVQRPAHRAAAEAVVHPGRLDVVVPRTELDVSQYGVAKSVDGREIQEVATVVGTLAPDAVVSVLPSAAGTSVPARGAVGDCFSDLM